MIAHSFPPEGNVGTFRTLRFVRKLPEFGWNPTIVSVKPIQYERFDPGLLESIPPEIELVRVPGHDFWQRFQAWRSNRVTETPGTKMMGTSPGNQVPQRDWGYRQQLSNMVRAIEASWYHPDMAMPWIENAVRATIKICQRVPIQVLWATAAPVSAFYIAQRSSLRTNVPYVLDFRDPWTITRSDFEARRSAWAIRRDRRRMHKLLKGAQAVVFRHATEAECFWQAYPEALEAGRIHLIPNGFEGQVQQFISPPIDKCTILYTGTVFSYRFKTLFEAVTLLKQREPDLAKSLCIRFVGEGAQLLSQEAVMRGISEIIEAKDAVPQSKIPSFYLQSHALLVLGREPVIKGYELLVGAKLFEYLKVGLPIIGVLPCDETRRVLEGVDIKTIADADSPHQIAHLIRKIIVLWANGRLSDVLPDRKSCAAYSSDRQTDRQLHLSVHLKACRQKPLSCQALMKFHPACGIPSD
jgi:hypothetical protein